MDSRRFDLIARQFGTMGTRRHAILSLAAGGLGLGLMQLGDADARKKRKNKKKNKKKRCKKLGQGCTPGGKRKCCGALNCEVREGNSAADCCIGLGGACETAQDCCEGGCLPDIIGGGPSRCTAICQPDCAGKTCGPDGCGGSCGSCALPLVCTPNGTCGVIVP